MIPLIFNILLLASKQWGKQLRNDSAVSLPLSYTKSHFIAVATCYASNWAWVGSLTLTTVTVKATTPAYWVSIGM